MHNKNSAYCYISKYRSELMGISILWVVWFHSSCKYDFMPIDFLKNTGYGGVDIFLLVSGMGIYHSLQKNDVSTYLKNRLRKILPVWWTYLVIAVILGTFVFNIRYTKTEILGFATFTGFWLDMKNQGNWYVYAIMLIYIVSPMFYFLIKESRNKITTYLIIAAAAIVISFAFFGEFKLIVFSRIPIYVMGMYVTAESDRLLMDKKKWTGCIVSFITGLAALIVFYYRFHDHLWKYGLWWYPFILIAPTLSLFICKLFDTFQKAAKPFRFVFSKLGAASLEILLISDFVFANIAKREFGFIPKRISGFVFIITGIIFGYLFHVLIECGKRVYDKTARSLRSQ